MYGAGVPVGMLVDMKGPRSSVLAGSAVLGLGYFPLYQAYQSAAGSMFLLFIFNFMTGLGSCMAFQAAVKTSALNWPHHRGTATAFPLAAFGLSAFFFSLIGSTAFPGNTSAFLLLLFFGTCGMTFFGFFFLRVYFHGDSDAITGGGATTDGSHAMGKTHTENKIARAWCELGKTSLNFLSAFRDAVRGRRD